jgi:3-deoxy-7-phosphoheptulonate synthase
VIIVTRAGTTDAEIDHIRERVETLGMRTHISRGERRTIIGCIGDEALLQEVALLSLPGVEAVLPVLKPYKLAAREFVAEPTVVRVGRDASAAIGARELAVIAGPCSVEGREMLHETARAVRAAGAGLLRGGAFKPRTSPYSFQGLGDRGLSEVGRLQRPVLLKRGLSATIRELLMAAEYVMAQGNRDVVLCERGIRTFETATRNTLDVAAIPVLKAETHLPVIVDPSHAGGRADLVAPLAFAAVAAGADGLIVEVHPAPEHALSDGDQSLSPAAFAEQMRRLAPFATAAGRALAAAPGEVGGAGGDARAGGLAA